MRPVNPGLLMALLALACVPARAADTFESLYDAARIKARAAFLTPTPVLTALSLKEIQALSNETIPSAMGSGPRRDLVVGFIEALEAVAVLQGASGAAPLELGEKRRLMALVRERLGLTDAQWDAGRAVYVYDRVAPPPFSAGFSANQRSGASFTRAVGAAGLIVGWTGREAQAMPLVSGVGVGALAGTPDAQVLPGSQYRRDFVRGAGEPPSPLTAQTLQGQRERVLARSRAVNLAVADAISADYDKASLVFKNAAEYCDREASDGDIRPGEGVVRYVARRTWGNVCGALIEPISLVERNVQGLALRYSDDRYSRVTGQPRSLRPDGYGITVVLAAGGGRRSFRDPAQGREFLRALPPRGAQRVVFYGHGAPGLQTVGEDFFLEASDVEELLAGKMVPGGRVDLIGCNTASIGDASLQNGNIAGVAGYGVATLVRAGLYGTGDEAVASQWNRDLAFEASRRLPGVYVTGMRTFAFPLDRLVDLFVPGGDRATPSEYVIGRRAVYFDGRETSL